MKGAKRLPRFAVLIIVVALVSACGEPRPSVAEWVPTWNQVLSIIPEEPTGDELPGTVCEDALASLRAETVALFPTPDSVLDDTVRDWVAAAEHTFFECPPNDGFDDAYGVMLRLEQEVDAVLAIDRD